MPSCATGPVIAKEYAGGKNSTMAQAAPRSVASSDGPKPPIQAAKKSAGNRVMNGSSNPRTGINRARAATMRRVAANANA